jgi:hypothetical protein
MVENGLRWSFTHLDVILIVQSGREPEDKNDRSETK